MNTVDCEDVHVAKQANVGVIPDSCSRLSRSEVHGYMMLCNELVQIMMIM